MDSFEPYRIESGASGVVFRISSNRVIKCALPGQDHEIEHENKVLERLGSHSLIVTSFGLLREGVLSLEYHPQTLRQFIRSGPAIPLAEWAIGVSTAVKYLHSMRVVHFDLNTRNILITTNGNLKLCDFACSSMDGRGPPGLGTAGDLRFSSPHRGSKATIQDDIFAMGSVFYELSSRAMPYKDNTDEEVVRFYCDRKFPSTERLALGAIITKCWEGSYEDAAQVLHDLENMSPEYQLRWNKTGRLYVLSHSMSLLCMILGIWGIFYYILSGV